MMIRSQDMAPDSSPGWTNRAANASPHGGAVLDQEAADLIDHSRPLAHSHAMQSQQDHLALAS